MRYWDSSAIVPLLHDEPASEAVRRWLREDPSVATWGLTRIEVAAAIERHARARGLDAAARKRALALLDGLTASWREVVDLAAVRSRALQFVARHPLRAADAAQLAAALLLAGPDPRALAFACLDRRLADAAEREGLRVLTAPA